MQEGTMGGFVEDGYLPGIQGQLNHRFGPGDPIEEMAGLQRAFRIFSPRHTLQQVAALLDIGPADTKQRQGWYRFLDSLKKLKSDDPKLNGHDLIVTALKRDLESKKPLPVFFVWHSAKEDPRVLARKPAEGEALLFPKQVFLRISVPIAR
jgi:hypothetical protein